MIRRLQNPRTRSVQKVDNDDEARIAALLAAGYVDLGTSDEPAHRARPAEPAKPPTEEVLAALNGARDGTPAAAPEVQSPPPKSGKGSGAEAWAAYAAAHGVEVAEGASRDDVIAALGVAGVATE